MREVIGCRQTGKICRTSHDERRKVILFGATGMAGQGVLRGACLIPTFERVLSIVRVPNTLLRFRDREGYDARSFCVGVSFAGMKETDYRCVTYNITLAAAEV